ncbi:alcohol dehydrogenase-like 6 [Artemisia annua]|uniref:Alcohol dehydrogenase-like 6 n=1 Tax=Artemisia annua TaxID=35608 RepID=A0A2U1QC11_ARTAN|nr:alcohol dehydrogenase-like 6 [Artemisia annua]
MSFAKNPGGGVIKCKGAVAWGAGEALVIEDVEVSPPQPSEIRIKVVSTSLCRSDLTAWLSKAQPPLFPRIFGHEASGIVESVGQDVTEFVAGDHVLTLFIGECMSCKQCVSSKSNICQQLGLERKGVMHSDQKTRFFVKGKPVYHYCAVSSFCEYTVVHSGCAVKITKDAPLDKVCLLSCGTAAGEISMFFSYSLSSIMFCNFLPLSNFKAFLYLIVFLVPPFGRFTSFCEYTVVHSGCAVKITKDAPLDKVCLLSCGTAAGLGAAWNVADVTKGSTVAIFGLGTVGLSVAQGAKIRGASRIIGVDTNPEKSEKAKAFGVTDFINPNDIDETVQQVIKRITDGGADYSFECIGDTEMITTALQSCCDGWGVTVTLGVPKTKPEVTAHYGLFLTGRTLKGSLFGGWKPKSDLPRLIDMYLKEENAGSLVLSFLKATVGLEAHRFGVLIVKTGRERLHTKNLPSNLLVHHGHPNFDLSLWHVIDVFLLIDIEGITSICSRD